MQFPAELTAPLLGLNDPLACLLHFAAACWFGWQAQRLVRRAGEARRRAAALLVFALSAVLVLAISATYHGLAREHEWKAWLQRLDHAAIFLLIAGTLTGFHAVSFRGRGRLWMVGLVWAMALAALTSKLMLWSRLEGWEGLAPYLGLSAVGSSSIAFLPRLLPWRAFMPMGMGGAVYVSGAVADQWAGVWVVPQVLGPHEIFHVAVVAALLMHWRFLYRWATPTRVTS